jgi:hypothetical protein
MLADRSGISIANSETRQPGWAEGLRSLGSTATTIVTATATAIATRRFGVEPDRIAPALTIDRVGGSFPTRSDGYDGWSAMHNP